MQNILVIKLRYIGDVVLSTPLIRALRERYPHARITALVNPGTDEVLRHNPHVNDILLVPRAGWRDQLAFLRFLRAQRFDCVIDLTDGDRAAFLSAITGAPIRIGYNHERRWRGTLYSRCVKASYGSTHMVEYHGQALAELGIVPDLQNPQIFFTEAHQHAAERLMQETGLHDHKFVIFHPAARYWFKAWPVERFAQLSDRLYDRGYPVVVVGAAQDEPKARALKTHTTRPIVSLVGRTRLLDLAALLQRCALFIGNDAGPMHVAAAAGCPVVALFGPTDPRVWGPRGRHTTVVYKGVDCRGCFHPGCFRGEESCMKQISVEEVYAKAVAFLTEKG
ncbi:MAG: putative lipopolysaccharide heptosyltransferase III [Nitrospirae bacterium]|nr:MAG: putative lipopolysaccharide heptosyltransferase III [Nitrospirota bacterium]